MVFCSSKQGYLYLTAFCFILHLFFSTAKLCLCQMTRTGNCNWFLTLSSLSVASQVFGSARWKICLQNSNIWYIFPLPQIITYNCMVELYLFASLRSKCITKWQSFSKRQLRNQQNFITWEKLKRCKHKEKIAIAVIK